MEVGGDNSSPNEQRRVYSADKNNEDFNSPSKKNRRNGVFNLELNAL